MGQSSFKHEPVSIMKSSKSRTQLCLEIETLQFFHSIYPIHTHRHLDIGSRTEVARYTRRAAPKENMKTVSTAWGDD